MLFCMVEKAILAVLLEFSIVALAVFVKLQNPVIVSEQLTRFGRSLIQSDLGRLRRPSSIQGRG